MADGGATAANDVVELEAMRKEDSSWHPCQVSLCSNGMGLVIEYGNSGIKDIIVDKEEALTCLRVRSLPIQGGDCVNIQQGEHVLATQKTQSKNLFFDAEVEKALRVRHSQKIHCRCTFTIKWLHREYKGTLNVPSTSIMKMGKGTINGHPTISAFMNTAFTLSCSSRTPLSPFIKDMDYELDHNELLDKHIKKHIEEISNSVDASKKTTAKDILLGVEGFLYCLVARQTCKVDTKGQFQSRAAAASVVSHVQHPPEQNHMKRSTRSKSKMQREIEVKDPPTVTPSIQEEFPETRSHLSPLAARAALASLMSKLPQNQDRPLYHGEITQKQVTAGITDGTKSYISSVVNDSSVIYKLSSKLEASSIPFVQKSDSIVKSLFSDNAPRKPQLVDAYSEVLTKVSKSTESKISKPTKATRLTRSAAQQNVGISNNDINKNTNVGENLRSITNKGRFTRSTVHMEEEILTIETKEVREEKLSSKHTESDYSDRIVKGKGGHALKRKSLVASEVVTETNLLATKEGKSLVKKEGRKNKHDIKRKACAAEGKNLHHNRRVTRSTVRLELGNKTTEIIPMQEGIKFSEHVKLDLYRAHDAELENNVLETKESINSPLSNVITLPLTEETNKRRKKCDAFKVTQKPEENIVGYVESSRGKKKSSCSINQELRFSPRLRFLPQTHSQNKP